MSNIRKTSKSTSPPAEVAKSVQMDLFSTFFETAEANDLSNTIELWDAIPKFYVGQTEQNKLRTKEGFLPTLKRSFYLRPSVPLESGKGIECGVVISPAPISQKDGSDKAYYPAEKEELIESILRKFFEDQNLGMYDKKTGDSWVRFSLSAVRRELANRGHTASCDQIKKSIDILSNCIVTFYLDGKEVYRDPIISSLTRVDRKTYEKDGNAMWVCRLPALISYAIEDGKYMQYDYGIGMQLKTGLSRWMHQLISRRWRNAGNTYGYDLKLSIVERDSGYLDYGAFKDKRRKLERSLTELSDSGVIHPDINTNVVKDGRKIIDVEYRLIATESFRKKMMASNKRLKHNIEVIAGTVDNL